MTAIATRSLSRLLEGLAELPRDVEISDLTQDGRAARPGCAFLAVRGSAEHGLTYAPQAVANGARAVLWEPAPVAVMPELPSEILVAPVPHLREHASLIADRFFDAPSQQLAVAGITGTNGKTTCAYLLAQALEAAGRPAAYLGTIGSGRPNKLNPTALTTGDAVTVQRALADFRAGGARNVAMEVSSHALDQARVAAVRFRTAAFTNLTRDHLDYHGSMDSYGAAKARLFSRPELESRVINADDAFGRQLALDARGRGRLIVTGRGHQSHARTAAAFVRAMHVKLSTRGIELEFDSSWGTGALACPLVGDFNVDNLLTVLAVLLDWELPLEQVLRVLARVHAAPGRMETFGGTRAPLAVVDYAHTPDALRKALSAARAHCTGRLAVVFGCGGDRDPGKRPLMGAIAAELADELVITDDNPRTESPAAIAAGIASGVPAGKPYRIEHDRGRAIRDALLDASEHDVVLPGTIDAKTLQLTPSGAVGKNNAGVYTTVVDGVPAFVKVLKAADAAGANEIAITQKLGDAGIGPRLLGTTTIEGRPAIITEAIADGVQIDRNTLMISPDAAAYAGLGAEGRAKIVAEIERIAKVVETAGVEVGDLQFLYSRTTGKLYVIDPGQFHLLPAGKTAPLARVEVETFARNLKQHWSKATSTTTPTTPMTTPDVVAYSQGYRFATPGDRMARAKIDLRDLLPTQASVQRKKVESKLAQLDEALENPNAIRVIETEDGKLYILDGHHTVEAAKRAGKTTVEVQVLTLEQVQRLTFFDESKLGRFQKLEVVEEFVDDN